MPRNKLNSVRLIDIGKIDGADWEIVTGVGIIGVSYKSRHDDSELRFTSKGGYSKFWQFQNGAIITFRGSNLLYDKNTRTK